MIRYFFGTAILWTCELCSSVDDLKGYGLTRNNLCPILVQSCQDGLKSCIPINLVVCNKARLV